MQVIYKLIVAGPSHSHFGKKSVQGPSLKGKGIKILYGDHIWLLIGSRTSRYNHMRELADKSY